MLICQQLRIVVGRVIFRLLKPALDEHEAKETERFLALRESLFNLECGLSATDETINSRTQ